VSPSAGQAGSPPVTQRREFWVLLGYAVVLGVFGAFAGLIFIGVLKLGGKWYSDSHPGWLGGHWWWVAVAAAAGAAVGLVRRLTRLPWKTPGLIDDLQTEHVDPALVPGIAAVSAVSLIGGASLGPEKALGSMGGGAASWIAQRRRLQGEDAQVNTLAGFAGAYGGLFSSTVIVVMLIMEVARPGGGRFTKALAAQIVASSISFGIYFAIAGAVFLDDYKVPHYKFEDWQLLAGILLGLFAAAVVTLLAGFMLGAARLFGSLKVPDFAKSVLGGVIFGVVGVALPLTMFSGSGQLKIVLSRAGTLGLGLLAATLIAKMLSFAISQGSGFVGGPIFPSLFIGGTAGVIVHQAIPGVPLGLAFTCLLAAIPGALVAAPFAIVLMAAFLTQVGALQTAPILITVVTAFLTMQGVKYRLSSRKQARANAAKPSLATPCRTGWSRRIAIGGGRLLDVGCGPGILTVRLAHLLEEAVGLDPDLRWSAATGLIGWAPQQCPASGHRKGMWQDIGVPSGPGGWLDRGLLPRRVSGHRNGLAGTVGGCRRRVLLSPPLSPRAAARVTWPARMGSPWAGCRGLWPGTGPRATRRSSRGRGGRRPLRARSAATSSD
jgi:H+/Cl- antiporter ClcA